MINEQMIQEYIQDSLALVDEAIDRLSSEDLTPKCVNAIFRCLHTIKGASGFVGLETMSSFVHQFEEYFKPWQESGRGLNKEEAQCIIEGLILTQEALIKTKDSTVPEGPTYVAFLNKIRDVANKYDQLSFSGLESIVNEIKDVINPENEVLYQKEILSIGNKLEHLLDDIQSSKKIYQLPVSYKLIDSVIVGNKDITAPVVKNIEALEKVSLLGSAAFNQLDMRQLGNELNEIASTLNKPGFFLSWDIIKDLCGISSDIIEESFRRLWVEGISPAAKIKLKESTEPAEDKKTDTTPEEEKKVTKKDKKEEYIRISSSALQRMTDSTGDLVADRNAIENLIQEMGSHVPARYRRYLQDNYSNLDKHVNSLERQLNHLSNRQLNDVFRRLGPMVESLSKTLGKKVNLKISGGEIEIPRDLLRSLNDPLVHIVRNSLDHGIESPEDREKAGKPLPGLLDIRAERNEDRLSIHIQDDGKGLDPKILRKKAERKGLIKKNINMEDSEIIQLIFAAGFSTKEKVSDVSGRGVGMDVVRNAIESKGGRIHLESDLGKGTILDLSLPLSEGYRTQDILLVKAGRQTYGMEYRCLVEILDSEKVDLHAYREKSFFEYRSDLLHYVNLENLFLEHPKDSEQKSNETGRIIVLEDEQQKTMACRVDKVYNKVKVVVVPFTHEFLKNNPLLRGTAVLGTGEPYLILDFRDVDRILNEILVN
ncbi:Chemotaxis protein CheA [Candidatus Magnetomorum sp. HK-1]|nr:Chemotaxis protein CheA [Candidatus Magnetomorum sp. HK-1]